MNSEQTSTDRLGSGVNIVFALVVMSSYFSIFGVLQTASMLEIWLLVIAGTVYILAGIYGFDYCADSGNQLLQIAYFAIQIATGALLIYLGKGTGFNSVILLPLAGQAVMLLPNNLVNFANLSILLTFVFSIAFSNRSWGAVWSDLPLFLVGQILIVVFTRTTVEEKRSRAEVERLARELETANQQLREYALKVEELAISKERNRLAREIHDGLGHYLTTIHMQIQAARAVMSKDPERTQEAMETAQRLTQKALVDVRNSVAALRASPAESLPLSEQVREAIRTCEMAGVPVRFNVLGSPHPLQPQSHLTLYRAVQEGISNICKHAQATQAWITLDYQNPGKVRLFIRDDGVGASQLDGGFGLMGMRERVKLLNGEINVSSSPGEGTTLEIVVPE